MFHLKKARSAVILYKYGKILAQCKKYRKYRLVAHVQLVNHILKTRGAFFKFGTKYFNLPGWFEPNFHQLHSGILCLPCCFVWGWELDNVSSLPSQAWELRGWNSKKDSKVSKMVLKHFSQDHPGVALHAFHLHHQKTEVPFQSGCSGR